jgi:uncharacterized protein with NRDE domain
MNSLTKQDFEHAKFIPEYSYSGISEAAIDFIYEKVQSAKRLLKAELQDMLYPNDADDIIDACFQIPDGDDKE